MYIHHSNENKSDWLERHENGEVSPAHNKMIK